MIQVHIYTGSHKCRSYEIKKETALFGRGEESDVRINDTSVSRKHARVFENGKDYFIKDLRSKNGTWIDGNIIKAGEKVRVEDGKTVALGNVVLCLGRESPLSALPNQFAIDLSKSVGREDRDSTHNDTLMTDRRKVQQIYEITTSLIQSLDIREVFAKIIDSLFLYFESIDAGAILLIDEKTGRPKKAMSKVRDRAKRNEFHFSRSVVKRAIEEAKAIMIANTNLEKDAPLSESLELKHIVSAMCVPLITKTATRGVIYVHSGSAPQGFEKEDLFFIASLGNPAAMAVENAMLYEKARNSEDALKKAKNELNDRVAERTAELTEANKRLNELTMTDGLTGLFNHRYLMKIIEGEFLRAVRYKRNLTLLLLDIDHFKEVNDSYGHLCGDMVLRETAALFKTELRSSDVLARYGGDELAAVLLEAENRMAADVAERLRKKLEKNTFHWDNKPFTVTCSAGVASIADPGIGDWNQLLDAADKALYSAKESGRNTVRHFQRPEERRSEGME
jgi:diguanylate cyclase (GGDEF)-like protein